MIVCLPRRSSRYFVILVAAIVLSLSGCGVALASARAAGSDVLIDAEKAYALTTSEVFVRPGDIAVSLKHRHPLAAEQVGSGEAIDLAMPKIDAGDLTVLPLSGPDALGTGQAMMAIGAPLGLVTFGIISALERGIGVYEDPVEAVLSIDPGNVGTLAPADRRLWGARFEDAQGNVFVADVAEGSAAARSGLRAGDVIVAVNQRAVSTPAELTSALDDAAGTIVLDLFRGGAKLFLVIREAAPVQFDER